MFHQQHHRVSMAGVDCPTDHDVLSGRGAIINSHPGNQFFRYLVKCNKERYVMGNRREKRAIVSSIIEAVHSSDPPRRFLEKDSETGQWHELGDAKAMEKASQALRNGAAALRKKLLDNPKELAETLRVTHAPIPPETELGLGARGDVATPSLGEEPPLDLDTIDILNTDHDTDFQALLSSEGVQPMDEEKSAETVPQENIDPAFCDETVGLAKQPSFDWGDLEYLDNFLAKSTHSFESPDYPETGLLSDIRALYRETDVKMTTQLANPFDDPNFLNSILDTSLHAPGKRIEPQPTKMRRRLSPVPRAA